MKEIFTDRKTAVTLTILILIIGSIVYFSEAREEGADMNDLDLGIYKGIKLKINFSPEGQLKIFALAKNNGLLKMKADAGFSLPESDSIVIGSSEAAMMKKEGLIKKNGDKLYGFFGIDTSVGGILSETGSLVDDIHFVSADEFENLEGDASKAFVLIKDNQPKLFITYRFGDTTPLKMELEEGNMKNYISHNIVNDRYYPLVLGATEAEMMRSERLFNAPGDIIKDFFGQDVIVVGVIKKTNTALDMAHIVPLSKGELN